MACYEASVRGSILIPFFPSPSRIQAPNLRALSKLDEAREKLEETNKEFDVVRKKAKVAKQNFERVKRERYDLFMKCFDHVSNTIDDIYKSLAQNQSAQVRRIDIIGI